MQHIHENQSVDQGSPHQRDHLLVQQNALIDPQDWNQSGFDVGHRFEAGDGPDEHVELGPLMTDKGVASVLLGD